MSRVFIYRLIDSYTVVEMLNYNSTNNFKIIGYMYPLVFLTLTIFGDVLTHTTKHLTCQLKLLARYLTTSIGIIIIIIRHANIIKEKKNHMAAIAVFLNLMLHKTKIYLFLLYLVNHRSIWCKLVGFNCFLVKKTAMICSA